MVLFGRLVLIWMRSCCAVHSLQLRWRKQLRKNVTYVFRVSVQCQLWELALVIETVMRFAISHISLESILWRMTRVIRESFLYFFILNVGHIFVDFSLSKVVKWSYVLLNVISIFYSHFYKVCIIKIFF